MTATLEGKFTEPGVYEDVPDAEYHADPVDGGSLSSTGARALLPPGCPAKFRYEQLHPSPSRKVFEFGKAAHGMVLGTGPDLVIVDADDWRTKDAQDERDKAQREGAVAVLSYEYDQIVEMAAAIRAHPDAGRILRHDVGRTELTLVWRDVITGVMRRARIDYIRDLPGGRTLIVDYKTAKSADPGAISRAMHAYGYHQQGAYYEEGALELGIAQDVGVLLVVQEKTAPYLVSVVQITPKALWWGSVLNRYAIDLYAQCLKTDTWPGYTTDITAVDLPPYAERGYEAAQQRGEYDLKGNR